MRRPLFLETARGRPAGWNPLTDPVEPQVADVEALELTPGTRMRTRLAGLFLFLPFLARIRLDQIVNKAGYPGSKMVPATNALLSLLVPKLLDKERRSHIDDFNTDAALGLFAGLNILPKKSFIADYSYRTQRVQQLALLKGWVAKLSPILFPDADSFSVDFHAIPYRGEQAILDNHWLPLRGQAGPSVLTFFAQERQSRVLCYANANLTRQTQQGALWDFITFWKEVTGRFPKWLYFDSKLVPYEELNRLNQKQIWFATIRRRGSGLIRRLESLPANQWTAATIDIPKRRNQRVQYLEERVQLTDYEGDVRQIAVKGLGHPHPTLFITNHLGIAPRELIANYARRNGVEDALGTAVNFFHLDCLASEVRLNVDVDTVMTVLANGCYHWLASQLHGFAKAKPKQLFRKFVETSGTIEIQKRGLIHVTLDRRCHNPVIREAELDKDCPPIPWLGNARVKFDFS